MSDQGLRSGLTAPGGVLWLLYSVVASRGVERTREDLRSRAGLIGVDGCCDHAVINLLLFGRCFEHVDQDSMLSLNAGPSRVGVLINEPKIALADCLLTPLTPVWVMLCGGHYTVLWSDDDGVLAAGHTTAANVFADIAAAARVEEAAPGAAAGDLDDLDRAIVMSLEGELDEPLPPLPPSARAGTAEAGGGKRPPTTPVTPSTVPTETKKSRASPESVLPALNLAAAPWSPPAASNSSFDDEQLQQALAASLQSGPAQAPQPPANDSFDEQMTQAMAASLTDAAATAERVGSRFWYCNGFRPPNSGGQKVAVVEVVAYLEGLPDGVALRAAESEDAAAVVRLPPPPPAPPAIELTAAQNAARCIVEVLQTRPAEGGTKEDGPWEYEVVCKPHGSMEGGARPPPPGKWHCRDCYLNEKGRVYSYYEPTVTHCSECDRDRLECGYCHWLGSEELPSSLRQDVERDRAPDVVHVMHRRWPRAALDPATERLPKLCG